MADDVKLLAVIDANTKSFENALKRIERATNQTFAKADHSVKGLEASLRHSSGEIVSLGRNFATAFGAGILVGGIVELPSILKEVVKSVGDIGTVARTIGIGTDELQKLRFAAEQSSVSTEALDKGLQTFAKNLGLAAHGGAKDFAKVLAANGVALTDAAGKTKPVNEQFKAFADLVARAKSPQDALAIATIAFGRGLGQELLPALQGGAAGLDLFGTRLEALNGVIKDDTIQKAEELTKRFNELRVTVGTFAEKAAISLADFANKIIESGEATRAWLDALRAANKDAAAGIDQKELKDEIDAQKVAIAEAEGVLKEFKQLAADGLVPADRVNVATTAIQAMKAVLVELEAQLNAVTAAGVAGVNAATITAESAANAIITVNEAARRSQQAGFKPGDLAKIGTGTVVPTLGTTPHGPKGPNVAAQFQKEIDAIHKRTAALIAETETIGKSIAVQQRARIEAELFVSAQDKKLISAQKYATLQQFLSASTESLTPKEQKLREAIIATGDAYAAAASQAEDAKQKQDLMNQAQQAFADAAFNGVERLVLEHESLQAVLADTIKLLAEMALKAALLGQGPLAGLFGTFQPASLGGNGIGGFFGNLFKSFTGGGGPVLGSLSAVSASVTGGGRGAPVIQLNVVPGQMFEPVVERISGNVSIRHAASAETRAIARAPASARDNQRRFGTP